MISLSVTTGIADLGDYVFRNNISWEQEVEALLDYATEYLQARRFVVLYPDSREGREKLKSLLGTSQSDWCPNSEYSALRKQPEELRG